MKLNRIVPIVAVTLLALAIPMGLAQSDQQFHHLTVSLRAPEAGLSYWVAILNASSKKLVAAGYSKYPYYSAVLPSGDYAVVALGLKSKNLTTLPTTTPNITSMAKHITIYAGYKRVSLLSDLEETIELKNPNTFGVRDVHVDVKFSNGTKVASAMVIGIGLGKSHMPPIPVPTPVPTPTPHTGHKGPSLPVYISMGVTNANGSATIKLPNFPSLVLAVKMQTLPHPGPPSCGNASSYSTTTVIHNTTYTITVTYTCPPPPRRGKAYIGGALVLPEENTVTVKLFESKTPPMGLGTSFSEMASSYFEALRPGGSQWMGGAQTSTLTTTTVAGSGQTQTSATASASTSGLETHTAETSTATSSSTVVGGKGGLSPTTMFVGASIIVIVAVLAAFLALKRS